jgi:hypothetical protein
MQVANIDVKKESPVDHGEVICFSIYSENSDVHADFGNEKTCIWVDVLDGGRDVLMEFAPFFEDPSIKKVQFLSLLIYHGVNILLLFSLYLLGGTWSVTFPCASCCASCSFVLLECPVPLSIYCFGLILK